MGKGSGNGRSILGSPWHRFREKDSEGKQRMGFPAKACLGSVPTPAAGTGREAQASLFSTEQDEGTPGVARGRWQGRRGGDTPTLCGFVVQNQPEPPHVPRGSAPGRGWDVQCE